MNTKALIGLGVVVLLGIFILLGIQTTEQADNDNLGQSVGEVTEEIGDEIDDNT